MAINYIFLFFCPLLILACTDLPQPTILILGQTGVGKSTLANVLIGESVICTDCTFPTCNGLDTCTNITKLASGQWLGEGSNFTIVDSPGFGDSKGPTIENDLIDGMLNFLKDTVKEANAIVLLLNGKQERFQYAFQQTIREMEAMFGESFWDFTIIAVSHWAFDSNSISKRNHTGENESWFLKKWNDHLKEKFHLKKDLTGVFIDVFKDPQDTDQQAVFQNEIGKLWDFTQQNRTFSFKTIGDALVEIQRLKEEVQWLNDVITTNISEIYIQLEAMSNKHSVDIEYVRTEHSEDIESVRLDLAEVRTEHSEDIEHVRSDLVEVRTEHSEDIESVRKEHLEDIASVRADFAESITSIREDINASIMFSCKSEMYFGTSLEYIVNFKSCFVNKDDDDDGNLPMNISTGIFTAPKEGFYEFHFYGNGMNGVDTEIQVLVNGSKMLNSFLDNDGNDDLPQLSFHCILLLKQDDNIQLKVSKGKLWAHKELESVFTGKLVQKMK